MSRLPRSRLRRLKVADASACAHQGPTGLLVHVWSASKDVTPRKSWTSLVIIVSGTRPVTYVGLRLTGGMTMPVMLFVLIPLAILAAVVLVYELKRRRRPADAVDMASRVRALRDSTEASHGITPPGGQG
jgi:hypothetical protein